MIEINVELNLVSQECIDLLYFKGDSISVGVEFKIAYFGNVEIE